MSGALIFDSKLKEEGKYWLQRLAGSADARRTLNPDNHKAIDHPLSRSEKSEQRLSGRLYYQFDRALYTQAHQLAGGSPFLIYTLLVSVLKVCIFRYTEAAGTAVGSPSLAECGQDNTLVISTEVNEGESFREFLLRVRQTLLEAYAHQRYPYRRLLKELIALRDGAGADEEASDPALFDVGLALEGMHSDFVESGESLRLRFKVGAPEKNIEAAVEGEEGLRVCIEFDDELYSRGLINSFLIHLTEVLRAASSDVHRRVGDLEMLSADERKYLLEERNNTEQPYPYEFCLHRLFEAQASRTSDAIAVEFLLDQISYRELDARSNQLANYLRQEGVGPESRVGVLLARSVEMAIALLGIMKAGGAYVPLNLHDPQERNLYILKDAGIELVLSQGQADTALLEKQARVINIEGNHRLPLQSAEKPAGADEPENLIYVIYTSGSIGRPKGVMAQHRSVVNYLHWAATAYNAKEGGGSVVHSPLSFDLTVTSFWTPLLTGNRVILLPEEEGVEGLSKALDEGRELSLVKLTPSHLELLSQTVRSEKAWRQTRAFVVGGAALQSKALDLWREHAPETRVINEYGPTETVVGCCVYDEAVGAVGNGPLPIGGPIGNTDLYILDRRSKLAGVGVCGELYIGGAGVTRGYLGRAELTSERFLPNPFSRQRGARVYRSGDQARYLPNGEIEYLGRLDRQVKIRGYRIEPAEIEAALTQHKQVRAALVVVENEGDHKRLAAFITPENEQNEANEDRVELNSAGLREYLRKRLPEYMVPTVIVPIAAFPLTPSGKIDLKALPITDLAGGNAENVKHSPRSPREELLVEIFEEVLKTRVGIYDNFFDLGGHSLLATQVISRVRDIFEVEAGVRSIFEAPTVEGLATRIDELAKGERKPTPPLVRARRDERLPLSFAQQRLWFLDQLTPNNSFYNCSGAVRLEGQLDLLILERVINEIVRRHEVLRTRIEVIEGDPVQIIDKWELRKLEFEDWRQVPKEPREIEILRKAKEEANTGFDLNKDPLLRVKVLRLSEDEHVLLYTMHHIVSDGWSMGILMREVGALYHAFLLGKPSPLPELEIQYVDYAKWQRHYLTGAVLEREIGYWKRQLNGAAVMELPSDHPRSMTTTHRGGRATIEIRKEIHEGLKRVSQRAKATLFMTLMAAFKLILMRYCREEDVSVGAAIANRTMKGVESLIGFFVNTLVLRTDLSGNPSFSELIKREKRVALEAYAHQELPFEKLVEEINPDRDLSRSPLFQVMFVLQNTRQESLEIKGLKLTKIGEASESSKFDLMLTLTEEKEAVVGDLSFSGDLFEESTIKRMVGHFERALAEAVRNENQNINDLELLSELEQKQIVLEWNQTSAEYPMVSSIQQLFEEQVEISPESVAVVDDGLNVSYRELNRRANRLAHALRRRGVGPEMLVGICVERSASMFVGLLGIIKAGGAYLPLDPSYPSERLRYMLEDGSPIALLTEEKMLGTAPSFQGTVLCLDRDWPIISEEREDNPARRTTGENSFYVIYTSGSTGTPKGVIGLQAGAINRFTWMWETYPFARDESTCQKTPLSFVDAVWEIFGPLLWGVRSVILKNEVIKDPYRMNKALRSEQITRLVLVPSLLRELLNDDNGIVGLKYCISSGEALPFQLAESFRRRAKGSKLLNLYGSSEASADAAWHELGDSDTRFSVPLGRPIFNTQIYLLENRLQAAPVGVAAEICVGGRGLGRGYLNRSDLTAEKFTPHPFAQLSGERIYKTGDLGRYQADGKVEFLGRIDHQVKVRGVRIELGEIETILSSHPGIQQCVITAEPEENSGTRLSAYIVCKSARTPDVGELRRYLKDRAPDYMAPGRLVFLEQMPLTPSGKIDRRALASVVQEREVLNEDHLAPRTVVEEIIVGIYEELLRLKGLGVKDNFFELGGHSLMAMQAVTRLRDAFGVEIGVINIFEQPTAEGLAGRIEKAIKAGNEDEAPPLTKVEREMRGVVRLPLSFAQQRLWFIDQLNPGDPAYNIAGAVKMEGRLNLDILERVINEITRRHEVFRTRFDFNEDGLSHEPVQVIDEWEPHPLESLDLMNLPQDLREEEARKITKAESRIGFDLRRGPLLRVKVLRTDIEEYILLFVMHHIVSDAWSMTVLSREISVLYEAFSAGKSSPLQELKIQYSDYACWQRSYLQGEKLEKHLEYWRSRLGGKLPTLELPGDYPRPAIPTHRGASRSILIPPTLSESIRAFSKREGVTQFMTLLAVFYLQLNKYTAQEDIIVGASWLNRNQAELEALIGFFVNMLPIRTNLSGNPKFKEYLMRVKEAALGAYTHQELPFEKIVEELQPERKSRQTPFYNVVFGFQNVRKENFHLDGLKVSWMPTGRDSAKVDLMLWMIEGTETLEAKWVYSSDLFKDEAMARLHSHYEILLANILANPESRLDELDYLTPDERARKTTEETAADDLNYSRFRRAKPKAILIQERQAMVERAADSHSITKGGK
jgi:amino acid adenylation domain-containing protein